MEVEGGPEYYLYIYVVMGKETGGGGKCKTLLESEGYSLFTYSRFAYFRPKSGVSTTHKKTALCNVLDINELFNVRYNNNTTLLQYLDISVSRYSLYIFV